MTCLTKKAYNLISHFCTKKIDKIKVTQIESVLEKLLPIKLMNICLKKRHI